MRIRICISLNADDDPKNNPDLLQQPYLVLFLERRGRVLGILGLQQLLTQKQKQRRIKTGSRIPVPMHPVLGESECHRVADLAVSWIRSLTCLNRKSLCCAVRCQPDPYPLLG